jgi:4a-hydroxytetrahydrobiopterin dehydratase
MNYQEFIPNFIGMIGVSLVILAYMLLQLNYWKPDALIFSLSNLAGALCILFSLMFHWNFSSVMIELIWIVISSRRIFLYFRESLTKKKGANRLSQIHLKEDRNQYFLSLSSPEKALLLKELGNGWEETEDSRLKKTWVFSTYQKSLDFINRVALEAEKQNHHPVFLIEYKKVTVTIWTHNINALTQADYILASKI